MTHYALMLDMETLAKDPAATIVSIGIVVVDLDEDKFNKIYNEYHILDIEDQKDRSIDRNTIKWWMKQPNVTRSIFNSYPENSASNDKDLYFVITKYIAPAFKAFDIKSIWSKGVDFDAAILEHAFNYYHITCPWAYGSKVEKMCFRTLVQLYPNNNFKPSEALFQVHNAISDAQYQAQWLWNIWKYHTVAPF
jgi:3' exoribonuclease, RNase T-like